MGRRARSSVVVLSRRRHQAGGGAEEDALKPFTDADMTWVRLSAIFIGRLTDGTKTYEMRCLTPEGLNQKQECLTTKPELKLWLDALAHTLTFFMVQSGNPVLKWDIRRGVLTVREDLLRSPGYYERSRRENKIVKLIQWAIESIDQYYPEKQKGGIGLKTCRVIDENTQKDIPMVAFLNDDLRARYKCDADNAGVAGVACDVSFGVPSAKAPSAKAPSAKAPSAKESSAKAASALKVSPGKPASAPLTPAAITPLSFIASAPKSQKKTDIDIARPTVKKQENVSMQRLNAPKKQNWFARLFRRPVEL